MFLTTPLFSFRQLKQLKPIETGLENQSIIINVNMMPTVLLLFLVFVQSWPCQSILSMRSLTHGQIESGDRNTLWPAFAQPSRSAASAARDQRLFRVARAFLWERGNDFPPSDRISFPTALSLLERQRQDRLLGAPLPHDQPLMINPSLRTSAHARAFDAASKNQEVSLQVVSAASAPFVPTRSVSPTAGYRSDRDDKNARDKRRLAQLLFRIFRAANHTHNGTTLIRDKDSNNSLPHALAPPHPAAGDETRAPETDRRARTTESLRARDSGELTLAVEPASTAAAASVGLTDADDQIPTRNTIMDACTHAGFYNYREQRCQPEPSARTGRDGAAAVGRSPPDVTVRFRERVRRTAAGLKAQLQGKQKGGAKFWWLEKLPWWMPPPPYVTLL